MATSTQLAPDLQAQRDIYDAEAARINFPAYCEYVHGDVLESIMGLNHLCDHLQAWAGELANDDEDTLIVAPPETIKSTLFTWWIEFCMGQDVNTTILYVMNTATQAMLQNVSIQKTIETNQKFQKVFPQVRPDKPRGWSHDTTFIMREEQSNPNPSLLATGVNGPYQGRHPDRIFIDDPTDQQDVRSATIMAEQRERVRGVLFDRRKRGGVIKAILTRWGEADLVRTFKELEFKIIEQTIDKGRYSWGGGRLLCPELFPDSRILEIKRKKGGALFQMTYMCDPSAATGSMIKREWWRFYDPNTVPEFKYTIHSWDLSIGRKGGDYSAFGSWGLAKDGYYMTNGGRWVLTPLDRLNKMNLLYEAERPRYALVEDSSVSMDFIDRLQRETRMPLKPVSPGTMDKEARVEAIIGMIEAGRVWLPNNQPWVEDFIDECAAFPGGQHDDQVDQMSQALKFLAGKGSGRISGGGKMVYA